METLPVKEFRELGYLQELNRTFLHPLGLALSIINAEDNKLILGEIIDARKDPEGFIYTLEDEDVRDFQEKANNVLDEWNNRKAARKELLGYMVQPIPGVIDMPTPNVRLSYDDIENTLNERIEFAALKAKEDKDKDYWTGRLQEAQAISTMLYRLFKDKHETSDKGSLGPSAML
jgi:hypothetical protein